MKLKKAFFICLVIAFSPIFAENQTAKEQMVIAHVQMCIAKAETLQSNLNQGVLSIEGMSSPKVRHFLNNLCSMPNTHYLEIGCWKGSTFVAALYGNNQTISSAVALDNWSEFGGPKDAFELNCATFLPANAYAFHSKDCFKIDPKSVCNNPVNIYFYDGAHTQEDQELAFTHYNEVLDNVFVAVVDDWNHPPVSVGTRSAFNKLGYKILFERILPARWNGDTENWWNGLYIAVIRKG